MAVVGEVYSVKTITRYTPAVGNAVNGLNITHWEVFAIAGAGATNAQIATAFSNVFSANYIPLMSSLSVFQGVILQRILPLPILLPFGSGSGFAAGTQVGEALPSQTCGIITKREVGVGRKKRGRLYIPWPVEADSTINGRPGPGYLVNLNTLAGIMSAALLVGVPPDQTTLIPVLFHPTPAPGTRTPIATALAREYWGTQRRRSTAFKTDTPIIIP